MRGTVKAEIHSPGMLRQGLQCRKRQALYMLCFLQRDPASVVFRCQPLRRQSPVIGPDTCRPLQEGDQPPGRHGKLVFHMDHPGPDIAALLGINICRSKIIRYSKDYLQRPLLSAGEGVSAAGTPPEASTLGR